MNPRIRLFLVTEAHMAHLNPARLNMFSFRKNAGALRDIEATIISVDKPMPDEHAEFFKREMGPVDIVSAPRIPGPGPAPKLNALTKVDPSSYDVGIFMDCDTAVLGPLDDMVKPITEGGLDFLCRRGGEGDRRAFHDLEKTLRDLGCQDSTCKADHDGVAEVPQFNTGVFVFRSTIAHSLGETATGIIQNLREWKSINYWWVAEQCALGLACVKLDLKVAYLGEIYNSWGNLEDTRILHYFKSRYRFHHSRMFDYYGRWSQKHQEYPAERKFVALAGDYIKTIINK